MNGHTGLYFLSLVIELTFLQIIQIITFYIQKMAKRILIVFSVIALALNFSTEVKLAEPAFETFNDEKQIISLAQNQKFTLPITTRTITYSIETIPQHSNQCNFHFQSLIYHSLASNSLMAQGQIVDMIPLQKKQKVFLVDQNHNLIIYSLDEHFLLKKLNPKTNVIGPEKKKTNNKVMTISLAATDDEDAVYYITPQRYYVFQTDTFGVQILEQQKLEGNIIDIQKTITYKNFLFLLSKNSGIFVYKINKGTKRLSLLQAIRNEDKYLLIDMQFSKSTQLLYVLYLDQPIIKVFRFSPSDFPQTDKSFTILKKYDEFNIQSITNRHSSKNEENANLDLAISNNRQQQTLTVLFLHNYQSIIGEIFYEHVTESWKFVRYFKFNIIVNQIHIVDDAVLIVGEDTIGIFPIGIHPRLIDQQMNGIMRLTSIFRLTIFSNGKFVGLTTNTIEYGIVKLQERSQLNCKINQQSQIKSLKLKANLTACTNEDRLLYEKYCMYQKTFEFEQMKLTVSAPIANYINTGLLISILAIILGIFIILGMKKNKERQIKKLQLFFMEQQKIKQQPPPSSDRRGLHDY